MSEQPQSTPETLEDAEPSYESPAEILVAEELAYAQTEFMQLIQVGIDSKVTINDLVAKYPRIERYRYVFEDVYEYFLQKKEQIDSFWHENTSDRKELGEFVKFFGHPIILPQASPKASKKMAESIYKDSGVKVEGVVRAFKHPLFLIFHFKDEQDFHHFRGQIHASSNEDSVQASFTEHNGIPIVLTYERDSQGVYLYFFHECQHAINNLIKDGLFGSMGKNL